ncbi:MAG: hypothetical protein Q7S05_01220, partial [bacterium]|nr:hypothetical protein [bacterium]
MTNLLQRLSWFVVAASLTLLPAFAIADRGGDREDRGQPEHAAQVVQAAQAMHDDDDGNNNGNNDANDDNSGPGNANSVSNSGPGNMNDNDADEDNSNPGNVDSVSNSGSGSSGAQLISVSDGRGSDDDDDDEGDRRGGDEARIRVSANGNVEIRGAMITSISSSGSILGVSVAGSSFTVDASGARLFARDNDNDDDNHIALSNFAVGDEVRVKGVFSPVTSTSNIVASKIVNRSIDDECFEDERDDGDDDNDGISGRGRDDDDDDDDCVVVNPDVVAPIISAVASVPGVTSATITWTTNELSTSKVFVSTTTPVDVNASTTMT